MRQCVCDRRLKGKRRFCQVLDACSTARVSWSRVCADVSSHLHVAVGVCKGQLGVIHGQHQARAPHHQLMIPVRQLSVQVVRGCGASKGWASAGVGPRGVGADCDVAVGQVDVTVCQDEVRVVILQLALILVRGKRYNRNKTQEVTLIL